MQEVIVKKTWLITKLSHNRKTHRGQYELAFKGYRRDMIKCLEDNLELVKNGHKERIYLHETVPEDHTDDYDTALEMLEASVDDTINITAEDFVRYVQDDWHWKEQWLASTSKYRDVM